MPDKILEALDEEIAACQAEIERQTARLRMLEGWREDAVEAGKMLTTADNSANADNTMEMHASTRRQYSKAAPSTPQVARFLTYLHGADIPSLRALAQKARKKFKGRKISGVALSYALNDLRPIDSDVADWIAEETGFPATKKNWPKLRQKPVE